MSSRMQGCLFSGSVMAVAMACMFAFFFFTAPNPSGTVLGIANSVVAAVVLVGGVVTILLGFMIPPLIRDVQRGLVLKTGKPASAQVLKVENSDFSSRDSGYVIVKLTLLVQPEGEPDFEAVLEPRVSVLHLPAVGQILQVRYSPKNHAVVMS